MGEIECSIRWEVHDHTDLGALVNDDAHRARIDAAVQAVKDLGCTCIPEVTVVEVTCNVLLCAVGHDQDCAAFVLAMVGGLSGSMTSRRN